MGLCIGHRACLGFSLPLCHPISSLSLKKKKKIKIQFPVHLSSLQYVLFLFLFFKDFIYLPDRERAQAGGVEGRGRGGSRLPVEQGA